MAIGGLPANGFGGLLVVLLQWVITACAWLAKEGNPVVLCTVVEGWNSGLHGGGAVLGSEKR